MSKEFTKEDVILNKKEAIRSLNKLLEAYIASPAEKHIKKAHLISYWIKDYTKFLDFEEKFDPTRNIAYKRGNIVKVNFGFNIGSEYGGLHFGVVLDNHNDHSSPVLTVIPLTSLKENKAIHANSVDLGNELYRLLKIKYDTISKALKDEQDDIDNTLRTFNALYSFVVSSFNQLKASTENEDESAIMAQIDKIKNDLDKVDALKNSLKEKKAHNKSEQQYLFKIGREISQMKEGSVALVNQITTISKMRIFDPRNIKGVLSGISLSAESMDKINQKVKELYVF